MPVQRVIARGTGETTVVYGGRIQPMKAADRRTVRRGEQAWKWSIHWREDS